MIEHQDAAALDGQPLPDRQQLLEQWTRHLHCGFWEEPAPADGAVQDLAPAAEEMCRRLFRAAAVTDGMRILDVGCGTGGTLAALDAAFADVSLVGLNIDARELAAARRRLRARRGGEVELVEGDACAMPLPDGSFDLVLAIESILLFPSRRRFFAEVRRVLRLGGSLLVVDFLPAAALRAVLAAWDVSLGKLCGLIVPQPNLRISLAAYGRLAAATGFRLHSAEDWTRQTLPSYAAARRVLRRLNGNGVRATGLLLGNAVTEGLSRAGLLRYQVLSFRDLREAPR
jgi:ubiquinone/menaquinone biosynthesis C-methylase UbiE